MRQGQSGAAYTRIITGLSLAAVAAVLILVPQLSLGFLVFVAGLVTVGLWEFFAMARAKGIDAEPYAGIAGGAAVVLAGYTGRIDIVGLVFFAAVAIAAFVHMLRGRQSLAGIAATLLAILYVGWMPSHFVMLHRIEGAGPGLVLTLAVAIIFSDAGAYFVGKSVGRHKLAPKVSPKKTWEGAVGGVAATLVGMAVLYWLRGRFAWVLLPDWPVCRYLWVGALLAVAGQIGDLVESMMKRDAGVKDSGKLLPGHGGVLDRCDGFLFAGPLLYYIAVL